MAACAYALELSEIESETERISASCISVCAKSY